MVLSVYIFGFHDLVVDVHATKMISTALASLTYAGIHLTLDASHHTWVFEKLIPPLQTNLAHQILVFDP